MLRSCLTLIVTIVVASAGLPSEAAAAEQWSPPVDGPVVRGYEPPARPFGPRHLGLDYAAPPGTIVRAAGDGIVAFAGAVGRSRAVAIEHPGGRRTTYAYLRRVAVAPGTSVRRGDRLGRSGGDGPGHHSDRLHFGYRVHGRPEDPALLFRGSPPSRISLAPLDAPACPRKGPRKPRYTGPHLTAPGQEFARPQFIGVRH